jgi:hypothetical protein
MATLIKLSPWIRAIEAGASVNANQALRADSRLRTMFATALRRETLIMSAWRHAFAAFAMFCCGYACAAPYPGEGQLRTAIGSVTGLLKTNGIALEIFDAQKEGITQPLMSAVLTRTGEACLVFFNTRPENGLIQFFDTFTANELAVVLNALAVHEATHCFEQREAFIHMRFAKVLPADSKRDTATIQGYLSAIKSGALVTWGEALADISSVLYLKQAVPGQWTYFATRLAAMRHDLARKWPEHDTSAWLNSIIAADIGPAANENLFETALQLRSRYRPLP